MKQVEAKPEKASVGRSGILNAAAKLFREKGYAGVSLRSIASEAGIKAASIYYHFSSKDAVVIEILDAGILAVHREVQDALSALPHNASPDDVLREGIRGHLHALLEHGDYTSANVRIFGQTPENVQAVNLPVRRRYEKLWDDTLTDLQLRKALRADLHIVTFRMMLIGALNATLEWFDPMKGGIDDLANKYTDIFLTGVLITKDDDR